MTTTELTTEENAAITALKRLAKKWPDSLWLFAASGSLCVMKKDADGRRCMTGPFSFDAERAVATVAIECDGGDW